MYDFAIKTKIKTNSMHRSLPRLVVLKHFLFHINDGCEPAGRTTKACSAARKTTVIVQCVFLCIREPADSPEGEISVRCEGYGAERNPF